MRVCHPLPADLNAFTTSGDNLIVVEIFASVFAEPLDTSKHFWVANHARKSQRYAPVHPALPHRSYRRLVGHDCPFSGRGGQDQQLHGIGANDLSRWLNLKVTFYLLFIRHRQQLSFDFPRLWPFVN